MKPLTKRLALDGVLTIFMVAEMFIQYTGIFIHEIVGAVFFVTIVIHLLLERTWISHTVSRMGNARGSAAARQAAPSRCGSVPLQANQAKQHSPNRRTRRENKKPLTALTRAKLIVAILLLADALLLGFSSVMISTVLFDAGLRFDALYLGGVWYPVHAVTSYALCAVVLVHLSLHWALILNFVHIPYDPERRQAIGLGVGALSAIGVVALGINASGASSIQEALNATLASSAAAGEESQSAESQGAAQTDGLDSAASSSGEAESGSAAETPSAQGTTSKHGHSKHDTASSAPESTSGGPADSSSNSTGSAGDSDDSDSSSTSETSGICPLCPKRCSLSSPKCNKPYDAGLI